MKRFILTCAIIALITSCKTQSTIAGTAHYPQSTIIRDSVSVSYHPGTIQSLTDFSDSTDTAPSYGGAIAVQPQHDGLTSQAQRCSSARPLQIPQKVRVDTLVVERWHTREVPAPPKPIPRFYKRCTWGFWLLLLLLFGRIAVRIFKAIYLKR